MNKIKVIGISIFAFVYLLACEEEVKITKPKYNTYVETLSIRYNTQKENLFQLRKEVSEEPRSSFTDSVKTKEQKQAMELSRESYQLKKGMIIRNLQSLEEDIEAQKIRATEKKDKETLAELIALKREVSNLLIEIKPKRPSIN